MTLEDMQEQLRGAKTAPHRMRIAAGTAADIDDNLAQFSQAYKDLETLIHRAKWDRYPLNHPSIRSRANRPWLDLMQHGLNIADGILSTRSIPKADAKGLEMAYRLCSQARRMPQDIGVWFTKNRHLLELITKAAMSWPEKQDGSDDLFKVGPFTVHNTIGISGPALDTFKKILKGVIQKVKKNAVPEFARTLYGDVYLVGQIQAAKTAAWYNRREDVVYCRLTKSSWGFNEVFSLIHELGHRYTLKFASKTAIGAWHKHHVRLLSKTVVLPDLSVGDPLPVRIKGAPRGYRPVVLNHPKTDAYWFAHPDGSLGSISKTVIDKLLRTNNPASFPTAYSAESPEEHFCEALAMASLGGLPDEHADTFRNIWQ